MLEQAFLFVFSLLMVVGSLAAAVWLAATGQHGLDDNFLLVVCLALAFAFGLFLRHLIRGAR